MGTSTFVLCCLVHLSFFLFIYFFLKVIICAMPVVFVGCFSVCVDLEIHLLVFSLAHGVLLESAWRMCLASSTDVDGFVRLQDFVGGYWPRCGTLPFYQGTSGGG